MEAKFNTPSGYYMIRIIYTLLIHNHIIRKVTPEGEVSTYAGKRSEEGGYEDGKFRRSRFNEPTALAMDNQGVLYIADSANQRIRVIKDNKVSTIAGSGIETNDVEYITGGYKDGIRLESQFNFPKGIDVSEDGVIFIGDTFNNQIRVITADNQVYTLKDAEGLINGPTGVLYNDDYLYICDMWNNRIQKLAINEAALSKLMKVKKVK